MFLAGLFYTEVYKYLLFLVYLYLSRIWNPRGFEVLTFLILIFPRSNSPITTAPVKRVELSLELEWQCCVGLGEPTPRCLPKFPRLLVPRRLLSSPCPATLNGRLDMDLIPIAPLPAEISSTLCTLSTVGFSLSGATQPRAGCTGDVVPALTATFTGSRT